MADTKTSEIPSTHRDLLERAIVCHIATHRPDGGLQSNPVWYLWDGNRVQISQTRSRQKMRNIEHDSAVALSITDPDNPYRYLEVRGEVDQIDEDPDRSFIDQLSQRYLNQSPYPYHQPGDQRVIVGIRPTATSTMG